MCPDSKPDQVTIDSQALINCIFLGLVDFVDEWISSHNSDALIPIPIRLKSTFPSKNIKCFAALSKHFKLNK